MNTAAALPMYLDNNQSLLDTLRQSFSSPGPRGAQVALCSDCCGSNGDSCNTPEG